jgi:carbonic anhydrase
MDMQRGTLLPPTGDAHIIRNAGGRVSEDAIRSLAISQRLLGTKEV